MPVIDRGIHNNYMHNNLVDIKKIVIIKVYEIGLIYVLIQHSSYEITVR